MGENFFNKLKNVSYYVLILFCLIFVFYKILINYDNKLNKVGKEQMIQEKINERIECGYNQHIVVARITKNKISFLSAGNFYQVLPQEAIFEIGSITKLFTAHLALILCQEGYFSLDVPISNYLPEINKNITVRQILSHSSGIVDPPSENYYNKQTGNTVRAAEYTIPDLFNHINSLPLAHDPGVKILYTNLGYGLIGYLLEKISGKTYFEILKEKILIPLGMDHTFLKLPSEFRCQKIEGFENGISVPDWEIPHLPAFGGLKSTAHDLSLYLNYCFFGENIEKSIFENLTAPCLEWDKAFISSSLGWPIDRRYGGEFYAVTGQSLGFSSFMGFSPTLKEGIIVLTDASFLCNLGHFFLNPNFPQPSLYKAIYLRDQELKCYEGNYTSGDMRLCVQAGEGYLELLTEGERPVRLYPLGNHKFFTKLDSFSNFPIQFIIGKGSKKEIILRDENQETYFYEVKNDNKISR